TLEPEQFAGEIQRLRGLWPDFNLHFAQAGLQPRPPVRELSRWHLALALAAGAISGVVRSKSGRILVVKGDTYKDKVRKTEFTEDEDGNITEVRILTDRFIPIIRAWEMTPSSVNQGRVLTISSSAATTEEAEEPQPEPAPEPAPLLFSPGQVVMTAAVSHLVETGQLNPAPLLNRHLAGDWGTLDQEDWNTNQRALKFGDRLLSSYDIDAGGESRLWIITEANRSSTTLLLPSDY
ncbi:class I SAM-dependent methyltransferase, partial [Pseudomonas aeruginosa]|nr:class I SAM-dependent methyltransferase [Pseudomonas aeruginosa]